LPELREIEFTLVRVVGSIAGDCTILIFKKFILPTGASPKPPLSPKVSGDEIGNCLRARRVRCQRERAILLVKILWYKIM